MSARGDDRDEEELLREIESISPGPSSNQPRPRVAAQVGETKGSGGLRILSQEAERLGGGPTRTSLGFGRPDVTPGIEEDESAEFADMMESFKAFLSKDAARKLQGMIDTLTKFRKANMLDMVLTMRTCIQEFVAAETAGPRGLPSAVSSGALNRSLGEKGLTASQE